MIVEIEITTIPEQQLLEDIYLAREDGTDVADVALAELRQRHERYIYGIIQNKLKDLPLDPDEFYWVLIERICSIADKFEPSQNPDIPQGMQFRRWVGKIAFFVVKEEAKKAYAERDRPLVPLDEHHESIPDTPPPDVDQDTVSRIRHLMEEHLNENQIAVLRSSPLMTEGSDRNMTSEEIQTLANMLDTTDTNIRQLKSRAMRKLRENIDPEAL